MAGSTYSIVRLTRDRAAEAVDALSDAFYDYPVMRFTIGDAGSDYDRRLRLMVDVFTASRFLRDYPVLAVTNDRDEIVAVANINPPTALLFPPELERRYEELDTVIGPEANARLGMLSDVWKGFPVTEPHYHLGMIGVRHAEHGRGHARLLLDAVHEMSRSDPESTGVSLTTETPTNVPLYEHFDYRIIGHQRLDGIETWGMFRRNPA